MATVRKGIELQKSFHLIFDDYAVRENYQVMCEYVSGIEILGRTAFFELCPANILKTPPKELIEEYIKDVA